MRTLRAVTVIVLGISALAFIFAYRSHCRDRAEICKRYAELRTALSAADTNAVVALIAPAYRINFDEHRFMRLDWFARPLKADSKVLIFGGEATVWPKPNWYLGGFVPIGDTVEVTKFGGHWFFTGNVHLD